MALINHSAIPESHDLCVQSALLGIVGWAAFLSGNLVTQIARDGIVFATITLGKAAAAFKFQQHSIDDENPVPALLRYTELKAISKQLNSAFKTTFRMFLLSSLFMLTVFADQYFDQGVPKVVKFFKLINVVFLMMTFYYANEAAKVVIAKL